VIGQVTGALLRDRDAGDDDLRPLFRLLDLLYQSPSSGKPEGQILLDNVDSAGTVGRPEALI
jgi:hypothetical protein